MMAGSIDENMEQLGILMIAGVIAKWYIHFGEQFGSFLQSQTYTYHMIQNFTPRHVTKRNKNKSKQKPAYECSWGLYLTLVHNKN